MKRTIIRAGGVLLTSILALTITQARGATPTAPSNLTVTVSVDETTNPFLPTYAATLSWQGSQERGDGYRIYVKKAMFGDDAGGCVPGEATFELYGESTGTTMTIRQGELDVASAAYAYYVTAFNEEGESEPSNIVSTVCGRDYNDGDISKYNGSGISNIVTNPPTTVQVGSRYVYDVNVVEDLNSDPTHEIVFSLVKGPAGTEIDSRTGVVTWTPQEPGTYYMTVDAKVADGSEYDRQTWGVDVAESSVSGVATVGTVRRSSVYPNPASSRASITFHTVSSNSHISIVGVDGREAYASDLRTVDGENDLSLDLSRYAPGAYFVHVRNDVQEIVIPFMVAR